LPKISIWPRPIKTPNGHLTLPNAKRVLIGVPLGQVMHSCLGCERITQLDSFAS
jgi:hypothetical protein